MLYTECPSERLRVMKSFNLQSLPQKAVLNNILSHFSLSQNFFCLKPVLKDSKCRPVRVRKNSELGRAEITARCNSTTAK